MKKQFSSNKSHSTKSDSKRDSYSSGDPKPRAEPAKSAKFKRISFYVPKTFKGAQSREEEDRLAEGTVNRIALEILNDIEENSVRLDTLLKKHIHQNQKLLTAREKANISKTVSNIIKWKLRIDYTISRVLKMNADELDTTLKNAHRLGTWNAAFMNKSAEKTISLSDFSIPKSHGTYKEAVRNYIKILNKIKNHIPLPNPKKNLLNALSIIYSHPAWLIEKWIGLYGEEAAKKICDFNNADPPLTIRVNTLKGGEDAIVRHLKEENFSLKKTKFARYGFTVTGKDEIFSTASFTNGEFEIQDESSQLFAEWCDPKPNEFILDAYAGSGGKTIFFSAWMQNRGKIMAADRSKDMLEQLKKRSIRAGCTNIELAEDPELISQISGKADKVIVDAPCSGLGVLARNPDIKWRLHPEDLVRLAEEQKSILSFYSQFVKPGGELIYGTCTLNPDENEAVVRNFQGSDFRILNTPVEKFKPFTDREGFFHIRPQVHGLSGFFGCKLIRK